jgi:hypothetical protein
VALLSLFTMSAPLAHPSALERGAVGATSYVEGCWSPDLSVLLSEKDGREHRGSNCTAEKSDGATKRPFSLRRGLGSIGIARSSWASPWGGRCGLAVVVRATKKATLWVALALFRFCGRAANASASGRGRTGGAAGR